MISNECKKIDDRGAGSGGCWNIYFTWWNERVAGLTRFYIYVHAVTIIGIGIQPKMVIESNFKNIVGGAPGVDTACISIKALFN